MADARKPGGLGKQHPADQTTIELAELVKIEAEKKLEKFKNYQVIAYRVQVVAGQMYFIKVRVDTPIAENCVHLKVFVQPWTHTKELIDVKGGLTLSDPIEYF
jgi:hypothetical protein